MARPRTAIGLALSAATIAALGGAATAEGLASQEPSAGSPVETLEESPAVAEDAFGEPLPIRVVHQRGFLASSAADGNTVASGDAQVQAAGTGGNSIDGIDIIDVIGTEVGENASSAPARRLCYSVGYPCFINAECCSGRCVSTHVCGPSLR